LTWSDLLDAVALRAGVPRAAAGRVLAAFATVLADAVSHGDTVAVPGIGTFGSRWEEERTLRSVADGRKLALDGRWRPTFRASSRLRDATRGRTPQLLRDPEHQRAWRLAETLVGDLALYNARAAPTALGADASPESVHLACAEAFGAAWTRVCHAFAAQVPEPVRASRDHLALAARRRWATVAPSPNPTGDTWNRSRSTAR
jgi:DNA-binding protein HU-beta